MTRLPFSSSIGRSLGVMAAALGIAGVINGWYIVGGALLFASAWLMLAAGGSLAAKEPHDLDTGDPALQATPPRTATVLGSLILAAVVVVVVEVALLDTSLLAAIGSVVLLLIIVSVILWTRSR